MKKSEILKKIFGYIVLIVAVSLAVNALYYIFSDKGIPGRPLESNMTMEEWKAKHIKK